MHTCIKVTLYLFIIVVDLSVKCVICVLCCCFLVFLKHLMLSHNRCFPPFMFSFPPAFPSQMMDRSFTVLTILKWIQFCFCITCELCYVQTSINHCYRSSSNLLCMPYRFLLWNCHLSPLPSSKHLAVISCKCLQNILSNLSYANICVISRHWQR